ncbi:hypothetical protein [Nocardia sp. NPDC057440]|uniref:hypothetical protein n=1 Tax=Nocardia sp. NPDC057440 TaxID=3346134 RepID=UPI003670CD58
MLTGMMAGYRNAAICNELFITHSAAEKRINAIFAELQLPPSAARDRRVRTILEHLRVDAAAT